MNRREQVGDEEARETVRALVSDLLGPGTIRIERLGGGLTNLVHAVEHAGDEFVVRMSPHPAKINDYLKEQWAMRRAREVGVPTAEVLEVGCEAASMPYMIARKVAGSEATHHPMRFAILREMGRLAALIHTIPTSGFGQTFDWSSNQLSRRESWRDYLDHELKADERIDVLERNGILSGPQTRSLRATFADMAEWDVSPVLNHGDLRLKNVLADETGHVTALIDWEFCTSNLAPLWDLSLALHDLSIDAKQEFLTGYGLDQASIRRMAPALTALNLIHYAPRVSEAAENHEDQQVERFKTRLTGALDLFSL